VVNVSTSDTPLPSPTLLSGSASIPFAALVSPEAITNELRHASDPSRRRATFQVPYPVFEIVLEKKADLREKFPPPHENGRRLVRGIRFLFAVTDLRVYDLDFVECKYHIPPTRGVSQVVGASFTGCTFDKCIFGTTLYRHVRFERCRFTRCDFGMAQFTECQLQHCHFCECTGEHVSFSGTEIDPEAIMAGMIPPIYNYRLPCEAGELSPETVTIQWLEIRRALAAQLLKSNESICHTEYCDTALVHLKTAELKARVESLKMWTLKSGVVSGLALLARCMVLWLTLILTKGGTSMIRLVLIAILAIPAYAVVLSQSTITFQGQQCNISVISFESIIKELTVATSLFLAVGYTAFAGHGLSEVMFLTAGSALGLIWYALLAAVVIRRVYR
jgi:Pentapeptide repeats (9 copies)